MRTTINIDDDLLEVAQVLASQRNIALGKAVSDLMRKGLEARPRLRSRPSGFPVFDVPEGARPVTLETVKQAEEES